MSAVVGSVLNAINQGALLARGHWNEVVWWQVGLNYLVPMCVSIYAATRARMRFIPGLVAFRKARLTCARCGRSEVRLEDGDLVPACPHCGADTRWKADR